MVVGTNLSEGAKEPWTVPPLWHNHGPASTVTMGADDAGTCVVMRTMAPVLAEANVWPVGRVEVEGNKWGSLFVHDVTPGTHAGLHYTTVTTLHYTVPLSTRRVEAQDTAPQPSPSPNHPHALSAPTR